LSAEGSAEVELESIAERAAAAAGAPVTDLRPLLGGLSSITLAARLGEEAGKPIVLKVAPPGLKPVGNRDVLRQARVLRALARVEGLAVPEVLFTDDGAPPLFGMGFVEGESFEPVNSTGPLPPPDDLGGRAMAAAVMLARLHAVSPLQIGLGGDPVGGLVAEVERWAQALDTVDEDLRPGHTACAARLKATVPEPWPPAVLHGDWRLGNMLCQGRRIEAVIDWEIWSIGDPRIDLAWFVANSVWQGNVFATRPAPGLPGPAALRAAYDSAAGRPVAARAWFDALVGLKQAATMGLILKRNRRRPAPDPTIEAHAPILPRLLEQAIARLDARRLALT
jgi:aminoglycoside phosphotransferase (APT) family kinase protein